MPRETDARAERSAPEPANMRTTAPADRAASLHATGVESSTSETLPSTSDSTPPPTSVDESVINCAHAVRVTRVSDTAFSITRECCASMQQPLETPPDVPTTQQDSEDALQLLLGLMPHAATAPLGDDTDNEEEEMQVENPQANAQASSSRSSRKRQKSDDESSAPDARKFRKENAPTGTTPRRRARAPRVDKDGFTPAKKTAKPRQQLTTAPLGTSNSFDALSDSEEEDLALPPPQQRQTPPPLVIKFEGHFRELQNALNLLIGRDNYSVSVSGEDLHRVKVKSSEHFAKCGEQHATEGCEKLGVPHKDFTPKCKLCGEEHCANYRGCTKHKAFAARARGNDAQQRRVPAGNSHPRGAPAPANSRTKRRRGRRGRATGRAHSGAVVNPGQQQGNSNARNKEPQRHHRQPQNTAPAAKGNGGPAPHAAILQVPARQPAAPAAAHQAVAPPSPPQREARTAAQRVVAPPPAPLPRQAAPSAVPRTGRADQSAQPAPDQNSMADFPEPRWRQQRPTTAQQRPPRQQRPTTVQQQTPAALVDACQQNGGIRETGSGHVVGPRQDGDRIDRLLDTMQHMMARMSELMAAVHQ
ncbi:serine/arginine repetitive matrix protein 1-like, partial [Schistocerca cancellata]|uniref:serine/arginine repetitive matrix protein 1-like n=1 Tax=Schistocerca cancellata TaxID=274614 RepID=UPI002118D609